MHPCMCGSHAQQQNNQDPRKSLKAVEEIINLSLSKQVGPKVQKYGDAVRVKQDKSNSFLPGRSHTYSFRGSQA